MNEIKFVLVTGVAAIALALPLTLSAQESVPPAAHPLVEQIEPAPPSAESPITPQPPSQMPQQKAALPSGSDLASAINSDNLIGKRVRNSADEFIGQIDSLLVSKDARIVGVVLDVGGFLGLGGHKVVVPMEQFSVINDNDIRLPNGSKDQLRQEPAYEKPRG